MTPKRKKYLAKCSKREKELRFNINKAKLNLAVFKMAVTKQGMLPILKDSIKSTKCMLVAYRHELHRLKGMDRVVVPKVKFSVPQIREWGRTGRISYYATCKCGNDTLYSGNDECYCPQCGRRILWEKVK